MFEASTSQVLAGGELKGVSHNNPELAIVSSIVRQNMHSRGMPPLCSKTGGATKVKPRMTAKAHELAAKQIRVFPTGTEALAHTDQVGGPAILKRGKTTGR